MPFYLKVHIQHEVVSMLISCILALSHYKALNALYCITISYNYLAMNKDFSLNHLLITEY